MPGPSFLVCSSTGRISTRKDGPGISHCNGLELAREQSRASPTSAPTQSLPPTSRPGGPGSLSRAGLAHRLVKSPLVLCLTCISPYALCEDVIKNEEESEPRKLPTPIIPLLSLNMLG